MTVTVASCEGAGSYRSAFHIFSQIPISSTEHTVPASQMRRLSAAGKGMYPHLSESQVQAPVAQGYRGDVPAALGG